MVLAELGRQSAKTETYGTDEQIHMFGAFVALVLGFSLLSRLMVHGSWLVVMAHSFSWSICHVSWHGS